MHPYRVTFTDGRIGSRTVGAAMAVIDFRARDAQEVAEIVTNHASAYLAPGFLTEVDLDAGTGRFLREPAVGVVIELTEDSGTVEAVPLQVLSTFTVNRR